MDRAKYSQDRQERRFLDCHNATILHSSLSLSATRWASSHSCSTPRHEGGGFSDTPDPRASQLAAIEKAIADAGVLVLGSVILGTAARGVRS
jgi:hypothetical protein